MNYYFASTLTPFVTAYSQSDFFGKLIMLGLIALSAICWIVLVQKVRLLKIVKNLSTEFTNSLLLSKENVLSHTESKQPGPFANVFAAFKQKTLDLLNKNHFFAKEILGDKAQVYLSEQDLELVESHVLLTISDEIKKLEKNLYILSTITTLAPFLGLLGTVWGILITFSELHGGSSVAHNSAILGGLSMALATTVMGLLIAIPSLISHNYLKNELRFFSSDMEDFLGSLLSKVELQYRRVDTRA